MAVSKRLRFEILRRDDHTCRYCGGSAPDVKLTVDHVTPTALGGKDEASNLVAACRDCNAGKTSTSPDGTLVAEVRDDALRHAEMVRQAYAVLVDRISDFRDYCEMFTDAYEYHPPAGWENTLRRWHSMAVPIELVTEAARIASSQSGYFNADRRFRYLCGVVWNQIAAVDAVTAEVAHLFGAFMTVEQADNLLVEGYRRGVAWATGSDA